jgi:predicted transcriptional regulator YheO
MLTCKKIEYTGLLYVHNIWLQEPTDNVNVLKCAALMARETAGKPAGSICINFDVSEILFLSTAVADFNLLNKNHKGGGRSRQKECDVKIFSETMEAVINIVVA